MVRMFSISFMGGVNQENIPSWIGMYFVKFFSNHPVYYRNHFSRRLRSYLHMRCYAMSMYVTVENLKLYKTYLSP